MENINLKNIRKRKHSVKDATTLIGSTESKIQSVNKFIDNNLQVKKIISIQHNKEIFDTLSDVSTDDSDIEIIKVSRKENMNNKNGLPDKSSIINLDSDSDSEPLTKKNSDQSIHYLTSPDYHFIPETNFLNFEDHHQSSPIDDREMSSGSNSTSDVESCAVIHLDDDICYIMDGGNCQEAIENNKDKTVDRENGKNIEKKYKRKRKSKKRFPNNPELQSDTQMFKYWSQRYDLFERFDMGIKLDKESWYSVTPEYIAKEQAEFCRSSDTLLDGFCGAGGNTIQFAYKCNSVLAVDIDQCKVELTENNCQVYGVDMDRVSISKNDFFSFAELYQQSRQQEAECLVTIPTIDVVFLSPPWGGQNYLNSDQEELTKDTINLEKLLSTARMFSPRMIMIFLPRNTEESRLRQLLGPNETIQILKHKSHFKKADKKVKAITAIFQLNV